MADVIAYKGASSGEPKKAGTKKRSGLQELAQIKEKNQGVISTHGIGRRKKAVARVWLSRGTGAVMVNGKSYRDYFDTEIMRQYAIRPLSHGAIGMNYDVRVNVCGGGLSGQAGAMSLGIARALVSLDSEFKPALKKDSLTTVDSRNKERKKYGQKAARRKFQFVKR